MSSYILVTGAPGNIGTEVVQRLQAQAIPFRVGAVHPTRARALFGAQCDITHFDFLNPATYQATFAGIDRLLLVRPPALANVQRDIAPAVWAALGAGVQQIVFISLQGVEKNRIVPHHKIEQLILATGMPYTFLRASFFMQNLSTTHRADIRDQDQIALPVGSAKTSFIDVRDIAAVAVCALTQPGHQNKTYTLTGSEALDYAHVAAQLSATLHRPIRYTNPSLLTFIRHQLAQGQPLTYTLIMAALYTLTRFGTAKAVTTDVELILGRPPISFEDFATASAQCWQPNAVAETSLTISAHA